MQETFADLSRVLTESRGTLASPGTLSFAEAALRMGAALLFGGLMGWEREYHDKAAGLRTHMMISLAACLFTLVAFDLMTLDGMAEENLRFDPIRLVEAVTAGVAFLAAGMIILRGDRVRGLTTGGGMWLAGAIGLACGAGSLGLAAMATLGALVVLWLLRLIPPPVTRPHDPDEREDDPSG
ncbi:MgtC/SapB family protein [Rhodosalinus halophilus]|uniref:Protein MgtC n=1 Tax=Rhodosalinus halophilus TaxID=2259333 RepID=A0A365UC65_9RHOB|nr:MgtC/SapB family protein [Rhodosalinus halophilus]RBI86989.1 MgtC/SapB family protein [Rhodosalinus halophilus]